MQGRNGQTQEYYPTTERWWKRKDKKTTYTCWGLLYTYIYAADIFCSLLVLSVSCLPSDWLFCSYIVHQGHSEESLKAYLFSGYTLSVSLVLHLQVVSWPNILVVLQSPWVYIYTIALIQLTTTTIQYSTKSSTHVYIYWARVEYTRPQLVLLPQGRSL